MLKRVTGTVRITTPQGQLIIVSRGETMPVITAGSQIQILSGKVEIAAGGVQLILKANQRIKIAMNPENGGMEFYAGDDSIGAISATVGASVLALNSGSILNVGINANGNLEINFVRGGVRLETAAGGHQLTPNGGNNFVVNSLPPQQKQEEASPVLPKRY